LGLGVKVRVQVRVRVRLRVRVRVRVRVWVRVRVRVRSRVCDVGLQCCGNIHGNTDEKSGHPRIMLLEHTYAGVNPQQQQ
jgi:hypothetical protein